MKNLNRSFYLFSLIISTFLIFPSIQLSAVNSQNNKSVEVVEIQKTTKDNKTNKRLQRKINRFDKKIEKLKSGQKRSTKKTLIIIGAVLLLLGIISLIAISFTAASFSGLLSALLYLILGITLGIAGFVTLLIGLATKKSLQEN